MAWPASAKVSPLSAFVVSSCVVALATVIYFTLLALHTVNVPNADDFDMYLRSALRFDSAANWREVVAGLFTPHGEHFIVPSRLVGILMAKMRGGIDFQWIILLGNLALPVSAALLVASWKNCKGREAFVLAAPAAILLLQPQFYQASLWAAAAIEHLWVMPAVLLAFLLLDRERYAETIALQAIAALIAVFTQGNGIFCPAIIGLAYFLRRKYAAALLWLVVTAFLLTIHSRSIEGHVLREASLQRLLEVALYTCSFIGAPLSPSYFVSVILGAVLIAIFLFLAVGKKVIHSNLYAVAVGAFVLLTAIANGMARAEYGPAYAFKEARYCYPALFFLIAIYFEVLSLIRDDLKRQSVALVMLMCASIFAVASYLRHFPQYQLREQRLQDSLALFEATGRGLEYPRRAEGEAASVLRQAIAKKFYLPPRASQVVASPPVVRTIGATTSSPNLLVEKLIVERCTMGISGYTRHVYPPPQSLALVGDASAYFVPLATRVRPDLRGRHANGFFALSSLRSIPAGSYKIGVEGGDRRVLLSKRTVEVMCDTH